MTVHYKNHVHPCSHWLQQIFSWPKGPVKYILVVKMAIIIYWKLPIFQAWNTFVKKSKVFDFFEYFLRFNFENFLRFDTTSSMIVYHSGNVECTEVTIICQGTIRWKKTWHHQATISPLKWRITLNPTPWSDNVALWHWEFDLKNVA